MNDGASISSREVNRALREILWPALNEHGFVDRTDRFAWRYGADSVAVVNVQSFNSYIAQGVGSTTFSFAVNLGIAPLCSTTLRTSRIEVKGGKLRPREYQCDFRRALCKTSSQPKLARQDVWFVRPDGSNVVETVENARDVALTTGMTWFDEFSDLRRMLGFAEHEEESNDGTWGPGAPGSPHRRQLIMDLKQALSSPRS